MKHTTAPKAPVVAPRPTQFAESLKEAMQRHMKGLKSQGTVAMSFNNFVHTIGKIPHAVDGPSTPFGFRQVCANVIKSGAVPGLRKFIYDVPDIFG